jgi:hypothetical protein
VTRTVMTRITATVTVPAGARPHSGCESCQSRCQSGRLFNLASLVQPESPSDRPGPDHRSQARVTSWPATIARSPGLYRNSDKNNG